MAQPDEPLEQPPLQKKRRLIASGRSTNTFLRSWAWKREHRPDSARFEQPYEHTLRVLGEAADRKLGIQQAPFDAQGFASTVWDSSIVVAKFLEKQAALAAAGSSCKDAQAAVSATTAATSRQQSHSGGSSSQHHAPNGALQTAAPLQAPAPPGTSASQLEAREPAASAPTDVAVALPHPTVSGEYMAAEQPAVAAAAAAVQLPDAQGATHTQAAEQSNTAAAEGPGQPASQHGQQPPSGLRGLRCLDLSAGCGLTGIVMALLGGRVTATDLAPNLPLLRANCAANVPEAGDGGAAAVRILEHEWGSSVADLQPPFDIVVACDVMYIDEAVKPLVRTLAAVSDQNTRIYTAHGRNRQAEASFMAAATKQFDISEVGGEELDEVYQCSDVTVLRLRLK